MILLKRTCEEELLPSTNCTRTSQVPAPERDTRTRLAEGWYSAEHALSADTLDTAGRPGAIKTSPVAGLDGSQPWSHPFAGQWQTAPELQLVATTSNSASQVFTSSPRASQNVLRMGTEAMVTFPGSVSLRRPVAT